MAITTTTTIIAIVVAATTKEGVDTLHGHLHPAQYIGTDMVHIMVTN